VILCSVNMPLIHYVQQIVIKCMCTFLWTATTALNKIPHCVLRVYFLFFFETVDLLYRPGWPLTSGLKWSACLVKKKTGEKKPLAITLSGSREGVEGRDNGGSVNNVQYKSNQNCHYESPPCWIYPIKNLYKKQNKMKQQKENNKFRQ
jgi:hypothetical protein